MHVVATTNSLFETTDESFPLISGIPTVLLIDPCENCASFCYKNGRNWHFSGSTARRGEIVFYYDSLHLIAERVRRSRFLGVDTEDARL